MISVLLSIDYVKRTGIERGEFYVLLLFTTVGGMFMASANDLIAVFVSLELLSIPLYVLAAFRAPNLKSEESGMKYFILGAFSSAFFVYGAALIYGATGTTNLPQIFAAIGEAVAGQGAVDPAAAARLRLDPGRPGLQSGGRAVPHVDAGRVRRRADADHGLHERGGEGRRFRGAAAHHDRRAARR